MTEPAASTSVIGLTAAALWGGALGAFFFGALRWTVERLATSARPALLLVASYAARLAVAAAGLWVLSQGSVARLLAGLVGFVAAREVARRLVRSGAAQEADATHA